MCFKLLQSIKISVQKGLQRSFEWEASERLFEAMDNDMENYYTSKKIFEKSMEDTG